MGGGAVAEWSKALLERENKQNPKRSWFRPPPAWGHLKKRDICSTKALTKSKLKPTERNFNIWTHGIKGVYFSKDPIRLIDLIDSINSNLLSEHLS